MCGIFGVIPKSQALSKQQYGALVDKLFVLSESRGKESSGIAIRNSQNSNIDIYKSDIPATEFIRSKTYKNLLSKNLTSEQLPSIIAHSRLVTDGASIRQENNQPVVLDGTVLVHNGIVCNFKSLWENGDIDNYKQSSEVDSEVIAALIKSKVKRGVPVEKAVQECFSQIEGAASIAFFLKESPCLILATNTGSLYYSQSNDGEIFVFASEDYILRQTLAAPSLSSKTMSKPIWLKPQEALVLNTETLSVSQFSLKEEVVEKASFNTDLDFEVNIFDQESSSKNKVMIAPVSYNKLQEEELLKYDVDKIANLKRCSKCLLPESFPYIQYDHAGECNYCKNYQPKKYKGDLNDLSNHIDKFRDGREQFFICAFSGGRDSSYGLHLLNEMGVSPITFTYDWGMVTDLARRNVARMCGELGLENILVSADIKKKRENVRKNVKAWLKKPDLGMIPLFMAGDKHFLKWVNILKKQNDMVLNIWMPNSLENTDFKTGFCGIPPSWDKNRIDDLSFFGKFQMPWYYLKQFIQNPAYINSSLFDTASAYQSYYVEEREEFLCLFDYVEWDEDKINETLIGKYNWETAPDTSTTWRIGDGTAAFYNYVYLTIAGFTEVDTFRSNQIREGQLDRNTAMDMMIEENKPRYEAMKWYLDILNLNFSDVVKTVNSVKKMY